MHALAKLYKINIEKIELAVLAQKAENLVAAAPCGLMDQLTVNLGKKNKLLPLICQPHQVFDPISLPKEISFCGIDSGVRHAISGTSYNDVRTAAFMAYTIIAFSKGVSGNELAAARKSGDWSNLPFKGYLANIPLDEFQKKIIKELPDNITGKEFIEKYGITIDPVTQIEPDKTYQVKSCATHPVYENNRICIFKELIVNFSILPDKFVALEKLGELMLESHKSYSAVGLGNEYTDEIIEMVIGAGRDKRLFGARVSGGGSGGTVCILCYEKEGRLQAKKIYDRYKKSRAKELFFFSGSNQGAFYLNSNID
jgi:L-arabinokinase